MGKIRLVTFILVLGIILSVWLGLWDKFFETAVEWYPIWHWGP